MTVDAQTENIEHRTSLLFAAHYDKILRRTDRLFAGLLFVEWLGAMVAALVISPQTWSGAESGVHLHVWTALLLGGTVISLPIYLGLRAPGRLMTRISIAVGQMLVSALLIHVTGGRIETHFHIFGSLAFLAFYRDWRVLATATLVVVLDHVLRGSFWPQSVFGILTASPWRWVEHAAWVVFEVLFLGISCVQGVREMKFLARQQARLETTNAAIETEVTQRTDELRATEARLRLIVDAAPCGMVMMRDNGVITMVNRHMEEMFGFERAAMTGQPIEVLLPERFRQAHPAQRNAFFQNPQARDGQQS
jgi:PAS domain-containing protein